MILQLLLDLLSGVITAVIDLFPSIPVPSWVTTAAAAVADVLAAAGSLSYWVPLQVGVTVAATVLACMAAGFLIRVSRLVLSFFTGGGGA